MTGTEDRSTDTPRPATSFREYVRGIGPGLVVAMMWLGTGDLIDASVAGASYGYALIWGLVLALFCRYFYVSAISKYVLCNRHDDDGILAGFGRLWKGFPLVLGICGLVLCFVYESYLIKGAGISLYHLFG